MEGEALALIYGLESCRMFILGCPDLLVTVDHQPLTKIFSDQALENIKNARLLNFKERSLMYKFKIKLRSGKLNTVPDCASRYPAGTLTESPAGTTSRRLCPDSEPRRSLPSSMDKNGEDRRQLRKQTVPGTSGR